MAPLIIGISMGVYSFIGGSLNWWIIGYPIFLSAALTLGYGADTFWVKLRKRVVFGFLVGVPALFLAVPSGQWLLFGVHTALLTVVSALLGTLNPIPPGS